MINAVGAPQSLLLLGGTSDIAWRSPQVCAFWIAGGACRPAE